MESIDEVVAIWRTNQAITLELFDVCPEPSMDFKPGKGKTIRSNFVHLVGFRRAWAEERLKSRAAEIPKLDWKSASREGMRAGLELSSEVMEELLRDLAAKPKGGKWSPIRFVAYAIAHEANHRAQVEIALRLNGMEPDDAFLYGLWDWGKK